MPRRSSSAASEAWPLIATGRVCGTSPSSAPIVTTTCTPSASARSTMWLVNARHRIDGSTPCTSTRSRGARGALASKISTIGHLISRWPIFDRSSASKRIDGRLAWKS